VIGFREPKRPSASLLIPAEKKSVFGSPPTPPPPKTSDQRPGSLKGVPPGRVIWPRKAKVEGSKALIRPSAKLPTSRSLAN